MSKSAASPAATGPGGPLLEARIGASYLLAMLLDGEPRGVPGSSILCVQMQGAADDLPLDDVVVHCLTQAGQEVALDVQVKRSITFTPSDAVFANVLSQIATAVMSGKLTSGGSYLMGIATAQTTHKINGPYKEVLQWARRTPSAAFFRKLGQPKVANEDMRTFVTTVRARLAEYGAPADDDTVWQVLRHLQIFVFDFSDDGQSEALVRERCWTALDPKDQDKAGALWSTLIEIAQELAIAAGQINLAELRQRIGEKSGLTLAGARHNRDALRALAEASRHARESIRDSIAGAHLLRRARLDVVNDSLDRGRYLEILGDAGVGKSGILRALADEIATASKIIVMTPARLTPRGWTALRNEIGYQGSCADLLGDLAASGGGTILIDSVDMLGDEQRATVVDLVGEAARVPGLSVVVTARRSFGVDEPNWLPAEALHALGRAPSVVIDELSDDEVDELRTAAPELAPLLAHGHPAQEAVRNLFRLEWLFQRGQQDGNPYTEADMARLWWQTGDGQPGNEARDRTRILRALARQSLTARAPYYPTTDFDSGPLNALIKSGTLLEVKAEKVVFRHDVFRDWGVANLLDEDSTLYDALSLSRPAPASLFRGVELAARLALEGRSDAKDWIAIVQRLRAAGVHGSWGRAAVLALVRSENSAGALALAETELLAHDGALLRELIRTVMAVDTMPARQVFAGTQVTMPAGLEDHAMPAGPAWRRLVVWISKLGCKLPGAVVPDVIKLYVSYATAIYAVDPIIGLLVEQLHAWLMMMEGRPRAAGGDGPPKPVVEHDQHHSLHEYLRSAYLALCALKPALADEYLDFVLTDERASRMSAESIIMSPGNLAVAAPGKLAALTTETLIAETSPRKRGYGSSERPEPFTHTDSKFLSPAPARGPFLALLDSDPKTGLALIRRIVQHASAFDVSRTRTENDDSVTILLTGGPRRFNDRRSYFWSRDAQRYYSVTSALMALEAWSHARMDRGDLVEDVIADILGDEELPAAFLLLAVDLLLSHWAKAWRAAVPFVASPELLAWDRSRQIHDRNAASLGAFGDPEPKGSATRESLQKRASRAAMLERVLPFYTFHAPPEVLANLRKDLEGAAERLGECEAHSDFGDPRFMVRYALNVTDPANYQAQEFTNADGETQSGHAYVSPPTEAAHLAGLQETRGASMDDANRRAELSLALGDTKRSSPDLVDRAVPWARKVQESDAVQQSFDNSILIAAFLLMRDGTDEQRREHGPWALALFEQSAVQPEDAVQRMQDGLMFNPVGIATAGLVLHAGHEKTLENFRRLLEIAARGDPAAARGFGTFRVKLNEIDDRLPACLLRCAFAASVRPHLKRYGDDLSEDERRKAQIAKWRKEALDAEWRWLSGADANEPGWPSFPGPQVSVRDAIYIGETPRRAPRPRQESEYYADHQAAGVWLLQFLGREYTAPSWTVPILERYHDWTAELNGAGLEHEAELSCEPDSWNRAYFTLLVRSLVGLDANAVDRLCLQPMLVLPDRSFLNVMTDALLALDFVHFEGYGPKDDEAVRIRTCLVERLRQTSQWRGFARRPGYGIPFDLDGALGAALMCTHDFRQPPRCYVTAIGIGRAAIFEELLAELAEATPSLFVAKAVLSIASVSEDHPFAILCVKTIATCMTAFPDDTRIWADYSVGDEFCAWLDRCMKRFGLEILEKSDLLTIVDSLLSQLIRLGISSAAALEARTATR